MTESNLQPPDDPACEPPVFVAELVPHRSLGTRGFRTFMLLCAVLCVAHTVFFTITGAWPVALFFGLDFALLFLAFKASYRAARVREEVSLSRTRLCVRKISASGGTVEYLFNPIWTRFNIRRHSEIGIVSMVLSGEGRRTEIGSFLNPDDRESFATALTGALATVKLRI